MAKNLKRYYQAWKLRKQGKTLKKIGQEMGFSVERARVLVNYTTFILRKKNDESKELKRIMNRFDVRG